MLILFVLVCFIARMILLYRVGLILEASYDDRVAKAGALLKPPQGFEKNLEWSADFDYKKIRDKLTKMAMDHLSKGQFQTYKSKFFKKNHEKPLVEVYDQEFHGNCWAHSGASYLHAVFLRWFEEDDIGLSQLMPFEFVKNDRDIHNVLMYISSFDDFMYFDGKGAGSLTLFLYRVGPILGALLVLFGPEKHHDIARAWMNHDLFQRYRTVTAEGAKMNEEIAKLQQEIPLPYVLGVNLPKHDQKSDDSGKREQDSGGHAVVLVEKKKSGSYTALNSWGTESWDDHQEYEQRRQTEGDEKDDRGFFTIDFADPGLVDQQWTIKWIAPPGSTIDRPAVFQNIKNILQKDDHFEESLDEARDIVPRMLDMFPGGFESVVVVNRIDRNLFSDILNYIITPYIDEPGSASFARICDVVIDNDDIFPQGLNTTFHDGRTVLAALFDIAELETIKNLMRRGASMWSTNSYGFGPLHLAAGHREIKLLQLALSQKICQDEINMGCEESEFTALHIASGSRAPNRVDIVKELLKAEASLSPLTTNGESALHIAVEEQDNADVLETLIKFGKDLDLNKVIGLNNADGNSALSVACQREYLNHQFARVLVKGGASLLIADSNGFFPVDYAIENKDRHLLWALSAGKDFWQAIHTNIAEGESPWLRLLPKPDLVDQQEWFLSIVSILSLDLTQTGGEFFDELRAIVLQMKDALPKDFQSTGGFFGFDVALSSAAMTYVIDALNQKTNRASVAKICDVICQNQNIFPEGLKTTLLDGFPLLKGLLSFAELETIQILVDRGALMWSTNSYSRGPLHVAVDRQDVNVVQFVLDHKICLDEINMGATEADNGTALHTASKQKGPNRVDIIKQLLKAEASLSPLTTKGESALHYAVWEQDNTDVLETLIEYGKELDKVIDLKTAEGQTALSMACQREHLAHEFASALIKRGASLLIADANGVFPVQHAIRNQDKQLLKALSAGKDFAEEIANVKSPWMYALKKLDPQLKNMVFDCEASLKMVDSQGMGVLHHAVEIGDKNDLENIFRSEVIQKQSIDLRNAKGETPLTIACKLGKLTAESAAEFVSSRASVSLVDADGLGPLHYLILKADDDVPNILLALRQARDYRTSFLTPDCNGDYLLHHALKSHSRWTKYIALCFAEDMPVSFFYAENFNGDTPLMLACKARQYEVAEKLGTSATLMDANGTPFTMKGHDMWKAIRVRD